MAVCVCVCVCVSACARVPARRLALKDSLCRQGAGSFRSLDEWDWKGHISV